MKKFLSIVGGTVLVIVFIGVWMTNIRTSGLEFIGTVGYATDVYSNVEQDISDDTAPYVYSYLVSSAPSPFVFVGALITRKVVITDVTEYNNDRVCGRVKISLYTLFNLSYSQHKSIGPPCA